MFKINKYLKDSTLYSAPLIHDQRGFLSPLTDDINPDLINRVCFVGNFGRGVKRGIHYHKKEWKIYSVLTGAAKFLSLKIPENIIDENNKEVIKNYLEKNPQSIKSFVLSSRSPEVLVIPSWHANGWISLEDNTNVIFASNLEFKDAKLDDYRFGSDLVSEKYWEMG